MPIFQKILCIDDKFYYIQGIYFFNDLKEICTKHLCLSQSIGCLEERNISNRMSFGKATLHIEQA